MAPSSVGAKTGDATLMEMDNRLVMGWDWGEEMFEGEE